MRNGFRRLTGGGRRERSSPVRGMVTRCPVESPSTVPDGLVEAFWRCDDAVLNNDRETLRAFVAAGPHTLRGEGASLLIGHKAITEHDGIPTRQVESLQARVFGADLALLMARTRDGAALGLQTQLWQRVDARWVIIAAHVSPPGVPDAFDTTVWRMVGDPLVEATAPGPLNGLRVAVKDVFAVAGQRIGAGVPAWLAGQSVVDTTAPAVAALLAAGADVVGIARTDEFAYSIAGNNVHYGAPPNPAVPEGISGGSSSGPASAVALGQAEIGLGTDTAGSIRVPASYQGLVGIRTTHGAISRVGVLPLAPSFDTVGWLTRDVATSAAVARALLPESTLRPHRTLRAPVIEALAHADVRLGKAVERLAAASALPEVETVALSADLLEQWYAAFRTVQGWQAWRAHGDWISAHPGSLAPDVAARFDLASRITEDQLAEASGIAVQARTRLTTWLQDSVLVIPAAAGPAPSRRATVEQLDTERANTIRMTCLASLCGAPAVSLPSLRSSGNPVGLCLISAPGTDRGLLELAKVVQAAGR